jgi:hypothetical protein
MDNARRAVFEHNTVTNAAGFKLNGWAGGTNPVTIRYNQFTNMNGDVTGGGRWAAHAVQLAGVQNAPNVDIGWNEMDNFPNQSDVEDNISVYFSSGVSGSPINIHDNYVNGAWPNPPSRTPYFGTGVMLGDGGGNYEIAQNNIVIRSVGNGVAIAGGSNETLANNIVVSACSLSDGTPVTCGGGMFVDAASVPIGGNAQAYNNSIGQWQELRTAGRDDWYLPKCTGNCLNYHYPSTTLSGPTDCCSGPQITLSDENTVATMWQNKLAANGVTIGP